MCSEARERCCPRDTIGCPTLLLAVQVFLSFGRALLEAGRRFLLLLDRSCTYGSG